MPRFSAACLALTIILDFLLPQFSAAHVASLVLHFVDSVQTSNERLDFWEKISTILQNATAIGALVLGIIVSYFKFVRGRIFFLDLSRRLEVAFDRWTAVSSSSSQPN